MYIGFGHTRAAYSFASVGITDNQLPGAVGLATENLDSLAAILSGVQQRCLSAKSPSLLL
jgi:hypothetical protein